MCRYRGAGGYVGNKDQGVSREGRSPNICPPPFSQPLQNLDQNIIFATILVLPSTIPHALGLLGRQYSCGVLPSQTDHEGVANGCEGEECQEEERCTQQITKLNRGDS